MHCPGNPCILLSAIRPWIVDTVAARDAAILHRTSHPSPTRGKNACTIWFQRLYKRLDLPTHLLYPDRCLAFNLQQYSPSCCTTLSCPPLPRVYYNNSHQSFHFITPRTPLTCTTRTTESAPRSVHQIHQDNKGALFSPLTPRPPSTKLSLKTGSTTRAEAPVVLLAKTNHQGRPCSAHSP